MQVRGDTALREGPDVQGFSQRGALQSSLVSPLAAWLLHAPGQTGVSHPPLPQWTVGVWLASTVPSSMAMVQKMTRRAHRG